MKFVDERIPLMGNKSVTRQQDALSKALLGKETHSGLRDP
jgi:hypothetical protein